MKKVLNYIILLALMLQLQTGLAQYFTDVISTQGITFTSVTTNGFGNGVSFYDFNQDGWDDLTFTKENGTQGFYLNNQGNFQLTNFSLLNFGETKHLLWVDYDNDGDLDVFLTAYRGKNHLFRNDGNFTFTEVTASAGIYTGSARNYGASFGDYNKDGFLDLYICKYDDTLGDTTNLVFVNNLYLNNGDGTFTDVSFSAGVSDGAKPSFCSVWFDYDHDTWPDLYVVNDRNPDATLYHNNGDGTFTDLTISANLSGPISNFMSATIGDYNNDADLDLFVSNTGGGTPELPRLYDNLGNGSFVNVANQLNLIMSKTTWGGLWLDYDNDSWQDLYVASAFLNPTIPIQPSYFFKNNLPLGFVEDSSVFTGNQNARSHAVARGDLDNNGFYDIVVQNEGPQLPFLWQNSGNSNNHIKITLEGTISNKFAIGSWISVFVGGMQLSQYTLCGENYLGQNSQHHIFGLGQHSIVDSVHLEFPSGIVEKYYDLNVNQHYYFTEGQNMGFFTLPITDTMLCHRDTLILESLEFQSYLWNTGETTRTIRISSAGSYNLNAVDSNGVNYSSSIVVVSVVDSIVIAATLANPSCFDSQDASIILSIENTSSPYNVFWSNGQTGDSLINLLAGAFNFIYTDSFLCTHIDSFVLEAPAEINVQKLIAMQTPFDLGSIDLLINGGTAPYQIFLDHATVNESITDLDSGSYYLEVMDANACAYSDTLFVAFVDSSTPLALRSLDGFDWMVEPNPFISQVQVRFTEASPALIRLTLYDQLGKKLYVKEQASTSGKNTLLFSLNDLDSGIYYLTLQRNGELHWKKIIKE